MFKILVVEDDKHVSKLMKVILRDAGYDVELSTNGAEALKVLDKVYIDLIIVDIMMPEMNGYELTEIIRTNGINVPILMVTAKQMPQDKYQAFIVGADDYMTKPVDDIELLYRIKALLRRSNIANEQKLHIGKVTLDYNALTVSRDGTTETLPRKEFYLLFKLLSYPEKIFTRIQLMDEIWGMDSSSVDTTINVHINRLRKKFGDFPEFDIVTIKGIGYKAEIHNED